MEITQINPWGLEAFASALVVLLSFGWLVVRSIKASAPKRPEFDNVE